MTRDDIETLVETLEMQQRAGQRWNGGMVPSVKCESATEDKFAKAFRAWEDDMRSKAPTPDEILATLGW